jgi:ABC-2 type transport system ATP-binding protein
MIQAQSLSRYYGPFVGIEAVTFTVPLGQVTAVLGPNGAGKTTLMRLLTGFLPPTGGTALICGFDVTHERIHAASQMGYLPENGPLYLDLTPLDLLRFFGEARGFSRQHVTQRIEAVAQACDIVQILDKPIGKLSRGLRQRVGLAQALLHDPPVLIMDEPTAGLDPNQVRQFRTHVRDLRASKTVLISTHILNEVNEVADRVLFIHRGRLVFDGSPGDLSRDGSLETSFHRLTNDDADISDAPLETTSD